MAKTVLVTGASSGIGKATAIYLAQNGYNVYGGARRMEKMQELKDYGVKPIMLDVTKDESMVACVEKIVNEAGSIDILINSAGLGSYGALEDVSITEAKNQLQINLFGVARLIQLALPQMRKNSYGKIVNISSVGGKVGLPMGSWYHAGKFAIEGMSDSLRNEVRQFGIDIIVVEPGGIDTIIAKITAKALAEKVNKISPMMTEDAAERYLRFLSKFPTLANRIPLSYVASYLGITQSSLSRIRKTIR